MSLLETNPYRSTQATDIRRKDGFSNRFVFFLVCPFVAGESHCVHRRFFFFYMPSYTRIHARRKKRTIKFQSKAIRKSSCLAFSSFCFPLYYRMSRNENEREKAPLPARSAFPFFFFTEALLCFLSFAFFLLTKCIQKSIVFDCLTFFFLHSSKPFLEYANIHTYIYTYIQIDLLD